MTVYRVVTRGFTINAFATLEEAIEELKRLKASGADDVRLIAEVRGNECYDWCLKAPSIEEFLKCLAECEEDGLVLGLPPPLTREYLEQEVDDLGV